MLLGAVTVLLSAIPANGVASTLITQAWHDVFNGAADTGGSNSIALDQSGNFYFEYVASGSLHLRKLSPASDPYFDVTVTTLPVGTQAIASLAISPKVNGTQYLYAGWMTTDGNGNVVTNLSKLDANGVAQWSNPFTLSNNTGGEFLLSVAGDASGNAFLAFREFTAASTQLGMVELASDGSLVTQASAPDIQPSTTSKPIFNLASGSWIVAGSDNLTPGFARWGRYSASTGLVSSGSSFVLDAALTNVGADVYALPGGSWAVIHRLLPTGSPMPRFDLTVYGANGAQQWRYPALGSDWGNVTSVTAWAANSPVYVTANYPYSGSTYDSMLQLSTGGALNWRRNAVPADAIYPMVDGFFVTYTDSSATTYIEHGDPAGVLDWAHHYLSSQGSGPQCATFQNAIYLVEQASGHLNADRFITGPTLYHLGCPSAVDGGSSFNLTLTLNAPAPAAGLQVGLSSRSSLVTFAASHTQALNVTIPAGQNTYNVAMLSADPNSDTTAKFIAIQNGVRCNASTVLSAVPSESSTITSNFNGTAIAAGDTIWFTAVFKDNLGNGDLLQIRNSVITFSNGLTTYNLRVPDADIMGNSSATPSTSYDPILNRWNTVGGANAGNTLLTALAFTVPAGGLPAGLNPVSWSATFISKKPLHGLKWQWAAAVYHVFNTDYNALGVLPVDNADHAGTPENYKQFVVAGARGGGGANYTGGYSATGSLP